MEVPWHSAHWARRREVDMMGKVLGWGEVTEPDREAWAQSSDAHSRASGKAAVVKQMTSLGVSSPPSRCNHFHVAGARDD